MRGMKSLSVYVVGVLLGTYSAASSQQLPPADLDANARLEQDFLAYQPRYKEMRSERIAKTRALAQQVFALETAGKPTACSHQILFELESLLISSADFAFIDRRIRDLAASLSESPQVQQNALHQDPRDGLAGACYDQWFLKVYASYEEIKKQEAKDQPPQPLPRFLDRVNTPDKLRAYFDSIAISDVRATGVDHERELNEMLSSLTRIIINGQPGNYSVDPSLQSAMLDLVLHHFRNPETGWWGERYLRPGGTDFVDDLSITFHEVSYLKDRIPDMQKVIATALAVKDLNYPVGWLWQGRYWNHNNMDVITLFRAGWKSVDEAQQRAMAAEIEKMLDWCLHESLQPDGSFKVALPDGSVEDAEYYGIEFLVRLGFFDPAQRFWTDRQFPEASAVRVRLRAFLQQHRTTGGAGGAGYQSAWRDLENTLR